MTSVIEKIRTMYPGFPAAKRMVAAYFMNHYDSLHYSTLAELAEAIGVSDTTIINFCNDLGYSGFSGFKRMLRDSLHHIPQNAAEQDIQKDCTIQELVTPVVSGIQDTFCDAGNDHALRESAAVLAQARRVFSAGFHAQAAIAQEFCLQLRRRGWDATELTPGLGDYIEKVRWVCKEDFVVVFDFAPYSTGTMEIVQLLKSRKVPLLLVTDMGCCPCTEACNWIIRCRGIVHNKEQNRSDGFDIPAGVIAGYVLRSLAKSPESAAHDSYEELQEGVFSRFNSYGTVETKQW